MTNEELVVFIQNGHYEYIEQLWVQVRRFVLYFANKRLFVLEGRGGVDIDDLQQAGFLAMMAAVRSFKPEKGFSFVAYLLNDLKTEFAVATSYRPGRKEKHDPLDRAASIDEPLYDDEGNTSTLSEIIRDPSAETAFDDVAEIDMIEAVRAALDALPEDIKNVLIERYYHGKTCKETAQKLGMSETSAKRAEAKALRRLRHPSVSADLEKYL